MTAEGNEIRLAKRAFNLPDPPEPDDLQKRVVRLLEHALQVAADDTRLELDLEAAVEAAEERVAERSPRVEIPDDAS